MTWRNPILTISMHRNFAGFASAKASTPKAPYRWEITCSQQPVNLTRP
jgi:hypothetical protein